ncbi:methyl-accepting chemotaxis protein [Falsihalocynthiibacter sp. BN13B15]
MQFFGNIPFSIKLPLVFSTLALIGLATTGITAYSGARDILSEQAQVRLSATLQTRGNGLLDWYEGVEKELLSQTSGPTTQTATKDLVLAFSQIEGSPQSFLQKIYVTNNPKPADERHLFDKSFDGSFYAFAHGQYHQFFRDLMTLGGHQDVYLLDTNGNVIYSVRKGNDFAETLSGPVLENSGLAEVYTAALGLTNMADVAFSDIGPYGARENLASSFVAAPIIDPNGLKLGVLAFQLSTESIDTLMTQPIGLGETGEIFIAGSDGLLRSNTRFSETPDILSEAPQTDAVSMALAGETGRINGVRANGLPVHTAFMGFTYKNIQWALVADQTDSELFAPAASLRKKMIRDISLIMTGIVLISILVARGISRPIIAIGHSMKQVANHDLLSAIPFANRRDEIGTIAQSLENLREDLAEAAEMQVDTEFKGAAFSGSSVPMMMVDRDLIITHVNPAMYGMINTHFSHLANIQDREVSKNTVGKSLSQFYPEDIDILTQTEDPSSLPYAIEFDMLDRRIGIKMGGVFGTDNHYNGNVVEWQDVTEIRGNESLLNAIDSNQITAEFSVEGAIISTNENFMSAFGEASYRGQSFKTIIEFDAKTAAETEDFWKTLAEGKSVIGLFKGRTAIDRALWLEGSFNPVLNSDGIPFKINLIASDVSVAHTNLQNSLAQRARTQKEQEAVVLALSVALDRLSEGDLTTKISDAFSEDHEKLRKNFNAAVENLCAAMTAVASNTASIRHEAHDISCAADDLAKRTEQQAATLEETASSLDAMTQSVQSTAKGALQANIVVDAAKGKAENSGLVVEKTISAMSAIAESSDRISRISSVIDEIAFQTNLLALNAGVEAARAGEAGRGFAVVASEVRDLSLRSSDAAKQINEIILESANHVKLGEQLVGETGSALREIVLSVKDISAHMVEITNSSSEQSSGLAEINNSINQLDQVTQMNAAMFEETTAASHSLTSEAEKLNHLVSKFSISHTIGEAQSKALARKTAA